MAKDLARWHKIGDIHTIHTITQDTAVLALMKATKVEQRGGELKPVRDVLFQAYDLNHDILPINPAKKNELRRHMAKKLMEANPFARALVEVVKQVNVADSKECKELREKVREETRDLLDPPRIKEPEDPIAQRLIKVVKLVKKAKDCRKLKLDLRELRYTDGHTAEWIEKWV